jgi:3-oxoacyl-[acyl-carrier-protein] synthase III
MMYIHSIGHYIPGHVVPNAHFAKLIGVWDEDIVSKSGIRERRKALAKENTNTMGLLALENALQSSPFPVQDVNLIIGASYTPFDTVGTLAHEIQMVHNIDNAKAVYISSACSSFCNAMEIAEGYFATGKADKAIIVASEHNSIYNNESDRASGFLWGDGAAAVIISNRRHSAEDLEVLDINTQGLGHVGKSIHAVYLRPHDGGIKMPVGRDVFQFACKYMMEETENILKKNNLSISDIRYLIPHQANLRIIDYVRKTLDLSEEQVVVNLDTLGNTGCASSVIGLSQVSGTLKKGDICVITVFGGGYSSGAILLKK